jgi:hypothetical protein
MKAVLEFNLPEERIEHVRAVRAGDAWATLHELDQHLRSIIKYGDGNYKSPEELATYLRAAINDTLSLVEE